MKNCTISSCDLQTIYHERLASGHVPLSCQPPRSDGANPGRKPCVALPSTRSRRARRHGRVCGSRGHGRTLRAAALVVEVVAAGGWYLRGDIGIGIERGRFRENEFDAPPPGYKGRWIRQSIDDTVFLGAGFGYQFNDWLRGDIAAEYRTATAFRLHGSQSGNFNGINGTAYSAMTGSVSSTVVLANGYVDLGHYHGFTPYLGAGLGVAYNRITGAGQSDTIPSPNGPVPVLAKYQDAGNLSFHLGPACRRQLRRQRAPEARLRLPLPRSRHRQHRRALRLRQQRWHHQIPRQAVDPGLRLARLPHRCALDVRCADGLQGPGRRQILSIPAFEPPWARHGDSPRRAHAPFRRGDAGGRRRPDHIAGRPLLSPRGCCSPIGGTPLPPPRGAHLRGWPS